MKTHAKGGIFGFLFRLLLVLTLLSCNLIDLVDQGQEEAPPTGPQAPLVPAGGPTQAPLLTGVEIPCKYYVSPDGNDGASGSESQPWRSFQFAADSAQAGDIVCFRDGSYGAQDSLRISRSGNQEAPIVFIAYPGERPTLDGGNEVGDFLIFDQGASYLRISGFTLRNFSSWGISLEGGNQHISLDHLTVVGGEAGVHFTFGEDDLAPPEGGPVDHITLEDSLFYGSQYTGVDCTPGPCTNMVFRRVEVYGSGLTGESSFGSDGLAISRGYPLLIEDCYIHDNGGDGIDLNSRDRDGHAVGVIVRRNRVIRNHLNGIKLWAGGRIENNVVWGQGNSPVWIGTFHSTLEVVNNSIAYNMWDQAFSERNWALVAGYPEEIPSPQVELLLVNNLIAFNTGPEVGDPTGLYFGPGVKLTEHNNLYFSSVDAEITAEFLSMDIPRQEITDGSWTGRSGQGQDDLTLDPLFVSAWPQVDLQLQSGSPAVDAGDDAACPDEDYLGNPRPVDGNGDGTAACDIGAFEWR